MGALLTRLLPYILSGAALWGIGTVVKGVIYLAFLGGAVYFIGKISVFFGEIIDSLAAFPNFILDLQIITSIWTLARDFVNLFFILILIIIAFATIFNRPQGYRASELLPKLIIAALLVNFSLVITQTVIEFLYTPAPIFINGLGGANFTGKIADALRLHDFLTFRNLSLQSLSVSLPQYLATGGLIYILAGIVADIVLIWVGLILLIRLPMLIGLAVVSPITWLAYSFPKMQSFWDDWWCKLLYWSLIPTFLFGVIYFSLLINQSLETIQISSVPLKLIGISLDQFIILFVTATLLIGGLWWVNNFLSKTACLAGYNLANATFGRVRGWFWGASGWTAGKAARGGQGLYKATGIPGAAEGLRERIAEEGIGRLKWFSGAERKIREARLEDRFAGWAGLEPRSKAQTDTIEQAGKTEKDIENRLKQARTPLEEKELIDKLKTAAEEGARKGTKNPETIAAINALAKRGQLDKDLFDKAVENFKDMPLVLSKVFSEWKEGKFGGISTEQFLEIMRDKDNKLNLDSRRIMYSFAASDDGMAIARNMKQEDFGTGAQLLGRNSRAGRDYFKFWGDFSPTYVAKYRFDHKEEEDSEYQEKIETLQDAIKAQMEKASVKNFADYAFKEWTGGKSFEDALAAILEEKDKRGTATQFVSELRRKLRREGKDSQLGVLNKVLKVINVKIEDREVILTEPE